MFQKINLFFRFDTKEDTQSYGKIDGIIAILYFLLYQVNAYFWLISNLGRKIENKILTFANQLNITSNRNIVNEWQNLIAFIPLYVIPIFILFFVLVFRKQAVATLGLHKKHNCKACIIGIVVGFGLALIQSLILYLFFEPNIYKHLNFHFTLTHLFEFIVFVGLREELVFRAFLQSRITGLIRNQQIAILTVGIFFWCSHFFNYYLAGVLKCNTIQSFCSLMYTGVVITIIHIILLFLYKKTNNIVTSSFAHATYDLIIGAISTV